MTAVLNQLADFFERRPRLLKLCIYSFIIAICILLFGVSLVKLFPDIPDHNRMAYEAYHGRQILQVHFLYFVILMLPQLISDNIEAVNYFSVFILTLSVIWKFRVSNKIMASEIIVDGGTAEKHVPGLMLLPLCMLLCQNLIYKPSATMFLGFIPVNIWHNSTTIFLMPFALLLFYRSYDFLRAPEKGKLGMIGLLVLFNLIIKPSFFMAFVCVFPLFCFLRMRFSALFFYSLLLVVLGAAELYAESVIGRYIGTTLIQVKIHPFNVWSHWSDNIPLAFIASSFFPFLYSIIYFREVRQSLLMRYSLALYAFSLVVYSVLSESGMREFDANFLWQAIICNYILFLVSAVSFYRALYKKEQWSLADKLLIFAFFMHVLTGLIYIFKSVIWGFR